MKPPKKRFQQLSQSKTFLEFTARPEFELALDFAMLQMINQLPGQPEMSDAAANGFRIDGARRFIDILTNLPLELPPQKPAALRDNLEP